ncbi:MAG: TIGR03000 domain-containing protein [Gemmataceae bacterium]
MKLLALVPVLAVCLFLSEGARAQPKSGDKSSDANPYTYYSIRHPGIMPPRPGPWPPGPLPPPWWPTYRPWPYPVTVVQNIYTAPPSGPATSAVLPPAPSTRAVLVMLLPTTQTDLWADGVKLPFSSETTRVFTTPELEPGHTYQYTVKARWVQRAKNVEREENVNIQPGKTVQVDFTKYDKYALPSDW